MGIKNKIEISGALLVDIVQGMVEEVPGVDNSTPITVQFSEENNNSIVRIKCKAKTEMVNLFELAMQIQEIVYFKLTKDLDAENITVDVEID